MFQLQTNLITITTEDEQIMREESLKALKALERKTEECLDEIGKKKDESMQEIDTKEKDCVQVIDKMKGESIQEFGKSKQEGIKEINRNVAEGIVKLQAEVYKTTEAEAVKRQQNEREHMHIAADKEYKRKTDGKLLSYCTFN